MSAGHCTGAAGLVQIQAAGHRIMAVAKLEQLHYEFGKCDMNTCLSKMQEITPDHDAFAQLSTLQCGCLSPGDVLMLPAGYVTVEKTVNEHTIAFRALSHMCFLRLRPSLDIFQYLSMRKIT